MKLTKNTLMSLWSRKAIESKMVVTVAFVALLLSACGESGTTEDVTRVTQSMEVVTDVSLLPPCSSNNDGELVWVKGEATPRMCSDDKWFAVAEGSVTATCTTEALLDGSGVKVVCGGDSIGVVLNGKDGNDGEQGLPGEKGDKGQAGSDGVSGIDGVDGSDGRNGIDGKDGKDGAPGPDGKDGEDGKDGTPGADGKDGENGHDGKDGVGCSVESVDEFRVSVVCGSESAILFVGEMPDTTSQGEVALDSEKIAIALDQVSGVTQKGPFLSGSKVLVREMEDGRTLTQTGNSFNGKILNDNGEFRINGRMLVSQYVDASALTIRGLANWPMATDASGFSAIFNGNDFAYWSAVERTYYDGIYFDIIASAHVASISSYSIGRSYFSSYDKYRKTFVRCVEDEPVEP